MPKSTYMYWQRNFDRENPDKKLEELIKKIFMDNNQNYGYRRIQIELLQQGFNVNHKKIQRIMKKLNIQCSKFHKPYRKYRSYRGTLGRICDNKINRRFNTSVPHQKLTTDTSEFKYILQSSSGNKVIKKAYLDVFLDMYNGEIISHNLSLKPSSDGILKVLNEAIERTKDCQFRRTFHSDQGWGYQMAAYQMKLKECRIFQSMSRKGNCLDNSPVENFFSLLKQEMYHGYIFSSFDELKNEIDKYMLYYNHDRIKTKLRTSPIKYRLENYIA